MNNKESLMLLFTVLFLRVVVILAAINFIIKSDISNILFFKFGLLIMFSPLIFSIYYIIVIGKTISLHILVELKEFIFTLPKMIYDNRYDLNMWVLIIYILYVVIISSINICHLIFEDWLILATNAEGSSNTQGSPNNVGNPNPQGSPNPQENPNPPGDSNSSWSNYFSKIQADNDEKGSHGLLRRLSEQTRLNGNSTTSGRHVYTPVEWWDSDKPGDVILKGSHRTLLKNLLWDHPDYYIDRQKVCYAHDNYTYVDPTRKLIKDVIDQLERTGTEVTIFRAKYGC